MFLCRATRAGNIKDATIDKLQTLLTVIAKNVGTSRDARDALSMLCSAVESDKTGVYKQLVNFELFIAIAEKMGTSVHVYNALDSLCEAVTEGSIEFSTIFLNVKILAFFLVHSAKEADSIENDEFPDKKWYAHWCKSYCDVNNTLHILSLLDIAHICSLFH